MTTRTTPRRRRPLGRKRLSLLAPIVRYSISRDAYVLRGIGKQVGPVFVSKDRVGPA